MRIAGSVVLASIALSVAGCGDDGPGGIGDAPPSPDVPPDARPCGVRDGQRGLTPREVTIDGLVRTYLVYLPPDRDPQTPLPLVLVFHGFTMSGQIMVDATEYTALADREGIALAFPDGQGGPSSSDAPWNVGVGRELCPSFFGTPPVATGDDFAFVDAMKGDISDDQCIDRDHVFVTGFSMGAYFANRVGCLRDDVRSIAPHSGGTTNALDCTTERKPVILFHGLSDPVIPAGCSDPSEPMVDGHVASATLWAQRNGCSTTTPQIVPVQGGRCYVYADCPVGGQVQLCTFDRMSHCWAGGPQSAGIYACPEYASATQLEWEFWKTHAW